MTLDTETDLATIPRWRDAALPTAVRVSSLIESMTLEEKVAQLYGVWVGASSDGGDVAPYQHDMEEPIDLDELLSDGLGQLTRPFGTAPVDAALGALSLAKSQRRIAGANRFGIPALAHEECLAGFTAWGATAYPVPLTWGATFNPPLVSQMAGQIGASMRAVGVHQGLAPVLDVTRDPRWGRTEETIGEDPYLVGTIATAYITGLESAGIIATLKHFVGYSASKAARNLAPVSVGHRELQDVLLAPFEMAVRHSGVRSVMHAYTDIDGVPTAADEGLLTGLLRDTWGFDGTVVADYFGVAFLHTLHHVAETLGDAAALALVAGVDVELPTRKAFGQPLLSAVTDGLLDESYVDRALERVLRQKVELGLLDEGWTGIPEGFTESDLLDPGTSTGRIDLDGPEQRALARTIAEQGVVLVKNDGLLPVAVTPSAPRRIAVIGPSASDALTMLGCYSFPAHVGSHQPEVALGIEIQTLSEAVRAEFPGSEIVVAQGCSIDGSDRSHIGAAVEVAQSADLVIAVVGDRAGLFGRGTSGEGCDAESLRLPGVQEALVEALSAAGTPLVLVSIAGRPYALGAVIKGAAAMLQTFFPGEEGAGAIAGVISGRVNPSGRLPVSIPALPGSQPSTYLQAPLAGPSDVSNIDPTPLFAFGHGLGYTTFEWGSPLVDSAVPSGHTSVATDSSLTVSVSVTNSGSVAGADVVQLYLHRDHAQVVQPSSRLLGYSRVELEPGETRTVTFDVSADLTSFTGLAKTRVIQPGEIELRIGHSSSDTASSLAITLSGAQRVVDHTRTMLCPVSVD
ncbi:beta-glucosidase family protein [Subtercola sp. RTI3]|uniref:beta-xylosidase/alpha-l-arabinosidase n=1 Tax=Subtercola sp. RTI3 TaxID=3048639 RepID=UPI002B22FBBA|nr:glycoside hydrolase family 3 N-terminal domain-containing protein [Subtercola sp. RTI3]MEA9984258.1 glycoside hydrolase family 3 N-terminal domain-containing protein [Subtercola sp. RTI3]